MPPPRSPAARLGAPLALALITAALAPARPARAQDATDDYRAKFEQGMVHFQATRYEQAIALWDPIVLALGDAKAYRLLYNLGVANDELGRATRAASAFGRFLREAEKPRPEGLPPEVVEFQADAQKRLARLDARHGRIRIVVPGGELFRLKVDGEERNNDFGLVLYVAPGRHEVVVRLGSPHESARTVDVAAGAVVDVVVAPLPPPPPVASAPLAPAYVTHPPFSPIWLGVAGGLTAASLVLPIYLRSVARDTEREYYDPNTVASRQDLFDRYQSEKKRYELSWLVPSALAVGTGALTAYYVYGPRRREQVAPTVGLGVTPQVASVVVSGGLLRRWLRAGRQLAHLMLQPRLGRCSGETGRPSSTASSAPRRSLPVTGLPLFGRASSS